MVILIQRRLKFFLSAQIEENKSAHKNFHKKKNYILLAGRLKFFMSAQIENWYKYPPRFHFFNESFGGVLCVFHRQRRKFWEKALRFWVNLVAAVKKNSLEYWSSVAAEENIFLDNVGNFWAISSSSSIIFIFSFWWQQYVLYLHCTVQNDKCNISLGHLLLTKVIFLFGTTVVDIKPQGRRGSFLFQIW